ncbi:MAG: hypothetical protein H6811_08340 [Phycisphaeraceae bacterium]|nr:hypothetical protein [Phycisphaeraceae bacterium]
MTPTWPVLTRWLIASLALVISVPARAQPCDGVATFADGLTPVREVHVSKTGSDQTGDGSAQRPYASIQRGISEATPGTAVIIHAGTYPGGIFLSDVTGAIDSPIWIGGATGEARPVISGGNTGMQASRTKFVVLHDLEVSGAALNGINFDDGGRVDDPLAAHHLVFRRLFIHDIGSGGNHDGLKLSGLNDYWVIECEFARVSAGSGIDHVGCHRGMIARCTFTDMGSNAIQLKGGTEDVEIRWSRFVRAGQRALNIGGSTGLPYFRPPLSQTEPNTEARNIRVLANVIQGSVAPIAFVGALDCLVAHNTIIDPDNWILRILQETVSDGQYEFLPCGDNAFVSNLVLFDRSGLSTYLNIGPNTAPETFTFTNNLWYAHDDPARSEPTLPAEETDGVYGLDPLLADPDSGDVAIPAESPAAGAGRAPPPIPGDFHRACYEDSPSIGACEVGCAADLDGDGDTDGDDFFAYLDLFAAGDDDADFDGDGALDGADYFAFLDEFASGCA